MEFRIFFWWETTLSHIHHHLFVKPFFSKWIFAWLSPILQFLQQNLTDDNLYTVKPRYNVAQGTTIFQRYIESNVILRAIYMESYEEGENFSTLYWGKTLYGGTLYRGFTVLLVVPLDMLGLLFWTTFDGYFFIGGMPNPVIAIPDLIAK